MSRWGSAFRIAVAAVATTFLPGSWAANWQLFASVAESERQRRKRDKANQRARNAYNEALKDRLQMLDLQPDAPRSMALGRVRTVEGSRDRWTSGTNSDKLTMIVSLAGHEIDAVESWYVDDVPVTLDGSGWVQEAPWKATRNEPAQDTGTADGSGGASITLSFTPVGGSATATWTVGTGEDQYNGTASVSVSGTTATVSGAQAGSAVSVNYLRSVGTTYMRIRPYLGTSSQNIGDDLDAEYPGKITSTERFAGIAAFVLDLIFSPDVFPQGPPNVTAVLRGAKCYDPRLDSTVSGGSGSHRIATPSTWAWSENPALLALRYSLWSSGMALAYGRGITDRTLADVQAAATRCDISTSFTLRMPDTTTTSVSLPRHRCGVVIPSDADPRSAMDSIVDTMAGEWAFDGAELRLRAGMMASSVASIDQTWLVEPYSGDDDEDSEPIVTATQAINRELRWNRIVGKCYDPAQRYQFLPYPAVSDTTLITNKGEKRGDLDFQGVNHVAHAQHLASIEIRRRQAGAVYVLQCDPRAELLQLFDVVTLTLPDYGISAKTFEVIGVDISLREAPARLMLREIADAIYTVDAELKGVDPAPDSSLRAPWDVAQLGTLTVTSGTTALLDNSVVARAQVTWPAITGEWIRNGGDIEIQFARADLALPSGEWASWVEPGTSAAAVITGLQAGRPYLFRGRMVQRLPLVRGAWSATALHLMANVVTNTAALGGGNLIRNSSFEVDSDANGLADNCTGYSSGTTGSITNSRVSGGVTGGYYQRVAASGLATGSTHQAGIYQAVELAGHAGRLIAFSPYVRGLGGGTGGVDIRIYIDFYNAAGGTGSIVDSASQVIAAADTDAANFVRYTLSARVPSTAVSCRAYVWMQNRGGSTGAAHFDTDAWQFEVGAVPTAYAPRADELLAGSVGSTQIASGAVGTPQLADGAATATGSQSSASGSYSVTPGPGDEGLFFTSTIVSDSWTNNVGRTVNVEVTFSADIWKTVGTATGGARLRYTVSTGTPSHFTRDAVRTTDSDGVVIRRAAVESRTVSVANGATLTMTIAAQASSNNSGQAGPAVNWADASLRWASIKV